MAVNTNIHTNHISFHWSTLATRSLSSFVSVTQANLPFRLYILELGLRSFNSIYLFFVIQWLIIAVCKIVPLLMVPSFGDSKPNYAVHWPGTTGSRQIDTNSQIDGTSHFRESINLFAGQELCEKHCIGKPLWSCRAFLIPVGHTMATLHLSLQEFNI